MGSVDARHIFPSPRFGRLDPRAVFAAHGVLRPRVMSSQEAAALQADLQRALAGYEEGTPLPPEAWIRPVAVQAPRWYQVSPDPEHPSGAQMGRQLIGQSPEQAAGRERDDAVPIMELVREQIAAQQQRALAVKQASQAMRNYDTTKAGYIAAVRKGASTGQRSGIVSHIQQTTGYYPSEQLQAMTAVFEARAIKRQEGEYSPRAISSFELLSEQAGRIDRMHHEWEKLLVGQRAIVESPFSPETAPAKIELLRLLTTTLFSASPVGIKRLQAEYGEHNRELARFARQADLLRSNGTRIADRVEAQRAELLSRRHAVVLKINEPQTITSEVLKNVVGAFGSVEKYSLLPDRTIMRVLGIAVRRDEQGQPVYVAGKTSLARKFLRAKAMKDLAASQFAKHLGDGEDFDREAIGGIMAAAVQKLAQEREERKIGGKIALRLDCALAHQVAAAQRQQEMGRLLDVSKQVLVGLRRRAA